MITGRAPRYPERPLDPSGAGHNAALEQVRCTQHYSSRMYLEISSWAGLAMEVCVFDKKNVKFSWLLDV